MNKGKTEKTVAVIGRAAFFPLFAKKEKRKKKKNEEEAVRRKFDNYFLSDHATSWATFLGANPTLVLEFRRPCTSVSAGGVVEFEGRATVLPALRGFCKARRHGTRPPREHKQARACSVAE